MGPFAALNPHAIWIIVVRRTGKWECSTRWMISTFRKPDTSCGILPPQSLTAIAAPICRHAFFEQTVFEGQLGHDLLQG